MVRKLCVVGEIFLFYSELEDRENPRVPVFGWGWGGKIERLGIGKEGEESRRVDERVSGRRELARRRLGLRRLSSPAAANAA